MRASVIVNHDPEQVERPEYTTPLRAINDIQHWSNERRLHHGQARRSHCQHRLAAERGHDE